MRYGIGRFLQVLGMATVLVGLWVGISVSNVRAELIYLGLGIGLFIVGRLLQGNPD